MPRTLCFADGIFNKFKSFLLLFYWKFEKIITKLINTLVAAKLGQRFGIPLVTATQVMNHHQLSEYYFLPKGTIMQVIEFYRNKRRVLTISSIFIILRTVSLARVMAEVETRSGCTTFSSRMFVIIPWAKTKQGVSSFTKTQVEQYMVNSTH